MKKVWTILLTALLLTGCYLVADDIPTSISANFTPDDEPSTTIETNHPLEPGGTETTIPDTVMTVTDTNFPTIKPTETQAPQLTSTPFPFVLQTGTPAYIKNFAYPSIECDWLGIAGQVFDEDGTPLINKVVVATGKINGKAIEIIGVTGIPEADVYGPGGFELKIADHVFSSEKALSIQVFDLEGIPISDSIPIDTFSDCEKNLIIINFQYVD